MSRYDHERCDATCTELGAVSFGLDPDCRECQGDFGVIDDDEDEFAERNIDRLTQSEFRAGIEDGSVMESSSCYSSRACDLCGSSLLGRRYVIHWLDLEGNVRHGEACTDCLIYVSNGELPDNDSGAAFERATCEDA